MMNSNIWINGILEKAIESWGESLQVDMAIEEMAELTKELLKQRRYGYNQKNIAEELADVIIMIEQMIMLYDMNNEVENQIKYKLQRLEKRLNQHE